ncbi:MAG: carbamoyltransferase HypF [Clostridiales Family XIII bacterium]|nr:carbamoyltransferase HypF [Clostridiales Family XIII bacterium]
MITQIITFRGVVQGVGFRPTVARLAREYGMHGQVRNMGGLVRLIVTDTEERIDGFVALICDRPPRAARIDAVERRDADLVRFEDFSIAPSAKIEDGIAIVPSDIAICENCLSEMRDPKNVRYRHPYISCTDCGPRFTIMERLPYDRDTTSMVDFEMCALCAGEYGTQEGIWDISGDISGSGTNVFRNTRGTENRRYHAQTISCHDCGPQPLWQGAEWSGAAKTKGDKTKGKTKGDGSCVLVGTAAIASATRALKNGEVIAFKGIGGYYFACSPFDGSAVACLREIKIREEKPFAILFGDVSDIRSYCAVNAAEETLLTSAQRPIVLLETVGDGSSVSREASKTEGVVGWDPRDTEKMSRPLAPGVLGGSRFIGAFLPSMGLQYLILDETGPLIMTSANRSDLPIIKDDGEMFALLEEESRIAGVLYTDRRIVASADDSVTRVIDAVPQLIRRSKGYVPSPIFIRGTEKLDARDMIFAAGGQLKSAFSLSKGSFAYLSPYMGDLDNMESEARYLENFTRMKTFFGIEPSLVLCDLHPNYSTMRFAESYVATHSGSRLVRVQHHHAHIASVMAEHGLRGAVIGVAFDGTGYGTDGAVWGGEILLCNGVHFERFSHLRYIDMIGGDDSMKDSWKTAVSHAYAYRVERGMRREDDVSSNSFDGCVGGDKESDVGGAEDSVSNKIFDIDIGEIVAYSERYNTLRQAAAQAEEISVVTDSADVDPAATATREQIEAAIRLKINTVKTSSMGRLFDAVSSLLGICHYNRYEGESATLLENAAYRALMRQHATWDTNGSISAVPEDGAFDMDDTKVPDPLVADALALKFHLSVASVILKQCSAVRAQTNTNAVALSGGVFQNRILMEESLRLLRAEGFDVYYNIAVPPNDGGIALGQNYIGMKSL